MRKIFIAALAFLAFAGCKEGKKGAESAEKSATEVVAEGDLAYVNVDYVLAESDIFKTEGVALRDKTEKTQQKWAKKEQNLQNDIQQLAEKYQKGLITSIKAAETEESLNKRIQNYQQSMQKEAAVLDEENFVLNNRISALVAEAIEEINKDGKYKLILNSTALLDGANALDITKDLLKIVNEKYAAEKAAAKNE